MSYDEEAGFPRMTPGKMSAATDTPRSAVANSLDEQVNIINELFGTISHLEGRLTSVLSQQNPTSENKDSRLSSDSVAGTISSHNAQLLTLMRRLNDVIGRLEV